MKPIHSYRSLSSGIVRLSSEQWPATRRGGLKETHASIERDDFQELAALTCLEVTQLTFRKTRRPPLIRHADR